MIRTVIADDVALARDALQRQLVSHPDVETVGSAAGGQQAIDMVRRLRPDLLLLDVQMPEVDGFAVMQAIAGPACPVVVLVTAPGISQIDRGEWGKTWFWSFTPAAMERLFGDVFGADALMIRRYGNVFAATMFLQGLAVDELDASDLDPIDRAYPVIVSVRARKAH